MNTNLNRSQPLSSNDPQTALHRMWANFRDLRFVRRLLKAVSMMTRDAIGRGEFRFVEPRERMSNKDLFGVDVMRVMFGNHWRGAVLKLQPITCRENRR